MTQAAVGSASESLGARGYLICLRGIVWREALRFLHQRERFGAALRLHESDHFFGDAG